MASQERTNAIQNVKNYIGKPIAIIAAVVLIGAFIIWYMEVINTTVNALNAIFPSSTDQTRFSVRTGAVFGLVTSLLAIGGIRLIKWVCTLFFPFLILSILYLQFTSNVETNIKSTFGFSFFAIISVVAITLPGFINLPTFFRHSRSKSDSFLALSLITLFDIIFQSSSIFIGISTPNDIYVLFSGNQFDLSLILSFIFISMICLNMVNIYFSSAALETILPHASSSKEYALVGLIGTAAYTFFQISSPMIFLENLADNFIASLGIILLLTFLVRIIVRHRPRPFEKLISCFCWFAGCITATIAQIHSQDGSHSLVAGICASILSFLVIIFIEETIWSIRHLSSVKKSSHLNN